MEKELEADQQFQVFLKVFHSKFGIEHPSHITTERREILATSIRIDAVVIFSDDFDFTKLKNCIFPWLGKKNENEKTGKRENETKNSVIQWLHIA